MKTWEALTKVYFLSVFRNSVFGAQSVSGRAPLAEAQARADQAEALAEEREKALEKTEATLAATQARLDQAEAVAAE